MAEAHFGGSSLHFNRIFLRKCVDWILRRGDHRLVDQPLPLKMKTFIVYVNGVDTAGKLSDARLDIIGKNSSDVNIGDFNNPGLYHVAVKVKPKWD